MFGLFSISKILVTGAIILGVWYGFKWLGERQQIQREAAHGRGRRRPQHAPRHRATGPDRDTGPDIEDMVQCKDCGAYVPDDGRHKCG